MDHIELSLIQSLDHCIKCNICTSACPVAAVTDKFPGPKYVGPQAQRFRMDAQPTPDDSVDYCSGCRVCNQVCPTGVRIAELNARARAQIVKERGVPVRNRLLGYSWLAGAAGSGLQAPLANFAMQNPLLRQIGESVFGVARKGPFPSFSRYTFRSWFKRKHKANTSARRQVVYFHGCSTNYYEPRIGKAAVAVLERNGFEVIVAEQGCCGLPLLSNGAFDDAKRHHDYNIKHLVPYIRRGIPVVGTSTSCTLTLKEETRELIGLDDADTRLLAENTYDIFEFLRLLHEQGQLNTDFRPLEATLPYHAPCQLRAHRVGRPALDVLGLVPGLKLNESHAACCGLAGTYGYKEEKYQIAMDVGAELFAWVRASGAERAVCDSEICRWQITHGSGVETRHPLELLAQAYGINVE
jgi:glycerol-3-phosphate dehydrogenase subunit C